MSVDNPLLHFERFSTDGCLLLDDIGLPSQLIDDAKNSIYQMLNKQFETDVEPWCFVGDGKTEVTRLSQIHLSSRHIYNLLTHPNIGKIAADITGSKKIRIWGTQLYYKPAGSGKKGQVGLHRDSQHVPYFKSGVLTAWLPLTNIHSNSGPLIYVKGSHQWDIDLTYSGGHIQDMKSQKSLLRCASSEYLWQESQATIPAGGICFHHMDMLHGSDENTSDEERIAIAFGLITDDATYCPDAEDFGYASILNDEKYCPVIYNK